MKDHLATMPILLVLIVGVFSFAAVMQPIFVWIVCVRLKRTNQLLAKMESQLGLRPPGR